MFLSVESLQDDEEEMSDELDDGEMFCFRSGVAVPIRLLSDKWQITEPNLAGIRLAKFYSALLMLQAEGPNQRSLFKPTTYTRFRKTRRMTGVSSASSSRDFVFTFGVLRLLDICVMNTDHHGDNILINPASALHHQLLSIVKNGNASQKCSTSDSRGGIWHS